MNVSKKSVLCIQIFCISLFPKKAMSNLTKISFILVLFVCAACRTNTTFANETNKPPFLHLDTARVAVRAIIFSDENKAFSEDSVLDRIDIYAATLPVFAKDEDEKFTFMERTGNIYHAEVPTETRENIGAIRLYREGEFIGGTSMLMRQERPTGITMYFSEAGDLRGAEYDYMDLNKWMEVSVISENARSCNPFVYTPSDTSLYHQGWQAVSNYKVSDAWPKQMQSALKECPMPEEIADWLTNNIKIYFAYQCILPYKNNAKKLANINVEEPPMGAYSFLDSIDYTPEVLLKYTTMIPVRYLLEGILAYPEGGLEEIGETPIQKWQERISHKLEPAMKVRPQFLLDMLAAMSYIRQIENRMALSDCQKENIAHGLPVDLGRIVLGQNAELAKMDNNTVLVQNYSDQPFDLKNYIDTEFPGAPVAVDFWNTWCGPCLNAINVIEDVRRDFKRSDIRFLYISDESSPEALWHRKTTEIGANHVRISRTEMSKLLEQYGLFGFPSYMFFDSDHNLVKSYTSFPGIRIYRNELRKLDK